MFKNRIKGSRIGWMLGLLGGEVASWYGLSLRARSGERGSSVLRTRKCPFHTSLQESIISVWCTARKGIIADAPVAC